jgi:DNA-binding Xre family transcriptional regulator
MLSLNLNPIFKARRISKPYTFLVKAGLTPHSATNILNNASRNIKLDHVELICEALLCEPNDKLEWQPKEGKVYAENFPLNKLIQNDNDNLWQDSFENMPFKELKESAKTIMNKNN